MRGGAQGARLLWVAASLAGVAAVGGAVPAGAQDVQRVVVDSTRPKLTEKDDGARTAEVALTNLTAEKLALTARARGDNDEDCAVSVPAALPARQTKAVTVEIDSTCRLDADHFKFAIDVDEAGERLTSIAFTAGPVAEEEAKPDWDALKLFALMPFLVGLLAVSSFFTWTSRGYLGRKPAEEGGEGVPDGYVVPSGQDTALGDDEEQPKRGFGTPLSSLEKSWSLKESWVSNITLGTALLTGVFGSTEVVTAILGEDAKSALATVIVGAAIASGLVAVGPLLLAATQTDKEKFTAGGLFLATSVVLSGALGELWVISESATTLPLGATSDWLPPALAAIVTVLLLYYTYRNVDLTLRAGTAPPAAEVPSETLVAAGLIVNAINADDPSKQFTAAQVAQVTRELMREPLEGTPTEETIDEVLSELYGSPGRSLRAPGDGGGASVAMI